MSRIELKHIDKFYGSNHVLRDINLTIEDGDFMTLLGPSGCGKTTTLRVVSGLEKPQNGTMTIDGVEMINADDAYYAEPSKRGLNLVFQSYALFPHLNIWENIAYGLRVAKIPQDEIIRRTNDVVELMQLKGMEKRFPNQLSGGQQQRVALARAVVIEPSVLLFDEPLSNLDAKLRESMRDELRALQQRLGITSLYVTHDQSEAMAISDKVVIMKDGVICQQGTPQEIYEQPAAVRDTISPRLKDGQIDLSELALDEEAIRNVHRLYIIGCGSAYHVGMAARYVFESLARIPVEVDVASEFRYRNPVLEKDALAMVISQSGETADTLAALRLCKERGVRTIGIVNVVGSSIAREADATMYTWAGPEISVATTKAYSTQLAACYLLATEFARVRGTLADGQYEHLVTELEALPEKIEKTLADKERIQWFASKYANAKDAFFIGRGLDYAVALEGSLKFKEISYIHSEAYASGELKHGTISLIEQGTLVIGVLTQSELYEKTISNMLECKSRGAYLMGLTTYGKYEIEDQVNFAVYVPKIDEHFVGSLAVVPLQLMGYYVSVAKGLDVDKPRNLAKSVTVE